MKAKRKRLYLALGGLALLGLASALVLSAFEENLVFFFSPSDLQAKEVAPGQRLRLGGLVETGSVARATDGVGVSFRVTDGATTVRVTYDGILPDLFREGQGVVAEGTLVGGVFQAREVLAKHDENYMPPEVADALKRAGQWQGGAPAKGAAQ
ncbi:MAG: cytochrome c maturation protein CcmE [Pseudomonadota bacterium]|nr:cytochrome c maturation protein CcmE [Pseudomonadota bacterium]